MNALRSASESPSRSIRLPILDGPWNADVWEMERPVRYATSGEAECAVFGCALPAGTAPGDKPAVTDVLCLGHRHRRKKSGTAMTLTISEFAEQQRTARPIGKSRGADTRKPTYDPIDFRLVHPDVAEQLRYVVSIRVNRNNWRDPRYVTEVMRLAIAIASKHQITDLLELPALLEIEPIRIALTQNGGAFGVMQHRNLRAALPGMLKLLESATADPWESEHWHPANLNLPRSASHSAGSISWGRVTIPWLKAGLKSLCKDKLRSGALSWTTIRGYVRGGAALSRYMDSETGQLAAHEMTRALYLDFVAWLRDSDGNSEDIVAARTLARLLTDMRDLDLIPDLPHRALTLRGDIPDKRVKRPKPFPDDIMEQIDELLRDKAAFPSDVQLMMRLFRASCPRATELLEMRPDVVTFVEGRGYTLTYFQTKIGDWRSVPLPPLLGADLVEQRRMVEEKYGKDCPYLFPYNGGATRMNNLVFSRSVFSPWRYGRFTSLVWSTYQERGIVTSAQTGESLTGAQLHRFRHSIATGLLNEGWSQHEVKTFMGHKSETMMQHYAEIYDDTLRDKYMTFVDGAVDIYGKRLPDLDPTQVDVERLREKSVRAELPNGVCVLPEKQNCDFLPSPCLSCVFFRTTPKFLPIHIRQRDDSLRELDLALSEGRERAVQTHEQTIDRLNVIIEGLEEAS